MIASINSYTMIEMYYVVRGLLFADCGAAFGFSKRDIYARHDLFDCLMLAQQSGEQQAQARKQHLLRSALLCVCVCVCV